LPPAQRDVGTLAAVAVSVQRGARLVRVHNVAYARQFFTVLSAVGQVPRRPAS
jgi:dihydropteroate synthase